MTLSARSISTCLLRLLTAATCGAWCSSGMAQVLHPPVVTDLDCDCRKEATTDLGAVLRVRLRLDTPAVDLSLIRVAKEVRAIWAPYLNVVINVDDEPFPTRPDVVSVRIGEAPADSDDALGWIMFEDGQPQNHIAVSLPRVRQFLRNANLMGRHLDQWPRNWSERFLAEAIGRAVAHELGHFVLRSPVHQPVGLMRAGLSADDVVRPRPDRFRLTPAEQTAVTRSIARRFVEPVPGAGSEVSATLR